MNAAAIPGSAPVQLQDGALIAVVGGGPSGAFFALHFLRGARALNRRFRVVIFERRRGPPAPPACGSAWRGCNYCAGGLSPKLNDILQTLGLQLPPAVIQNRISSLTIQGFWKNIELDVPPDRTMLSVFRGSRPTSEANPDQSFDSFLLDQALAEGAELFQAEVSSVSRNPSGKPVLSFASNGQPQTLEADFLVFASGVNEQVRTAGQPLEQSLRALMPRYRPARTRRALIFELHTRPAIPAGLLNTLFFVEYGSRTLPLEMCSLLPKHSCLTVVLVGRSVDAARSPKQNREVIRRFLDLPHIRRLFSGMAGMAVICCCNPSMVVRSARNPFGHRVSAVGDLVTARLYKDGILSAHQTASALAHTLLHTGIDAASLKTGYGPTLRHFALNNHFASLVFLLHRIFFGSSVLSRVLYQAVITERKATPAPRRHLEKILWRIASGDDEYREIFWSMVGPPTVFRVLTGGAFVTLRNYLTELAFGVRWEGFGRFTTGVSYERLAEKRAHFASLMTRAGIQLPPKLEFERMYTIKMYAPPDTVLEQLEHFGEPDRGWLRPRGVRIRRVAGSPTRPGCVIRYEIISPKFTFCLRLEQVLDDRLAVYRVMDGFARGGVLLFEIEPGGHGVSFLSIYLAFSFARGVTLAERTFWRAFRLLFPAYIHDVLWNHSLCQMRDLVQTAFEKTLKLPQPDLQYHI